MLASQPDGYLAAPPSGSGAPVLVLHPWWGLNATIRDVCDRFAAEGFLALAPDLYHGKIATTIPEAEALSSALFENDAIAKREVAAALDHLVGRAASKAGAAVIGFSMGAYYALDLSARAPDVVRSVVTFYGTGPADFDKAKADYLCHFAADDPYEPQESIAYLDDALKGAGRPATFHTYAGTGHWFFEPDRTDAYDAAAAMLAWERTLAFLRRTFSG
jgi:carboxymethylenebutenolidase